MSRRALIFSGLLLVLGCSSACTDIGYYLQSVRGHFELMSARQPVADLLTDLETGTELRARLELARSLVRYAHAELGLNSGGSYDHYADLGRSYVVWNVVATPALSLVPKTWCFPFAGCVPYRGYFQEQAAREFAEGLIEEGLDVDTYGVVAYSTLGWFEDPLLNTFLYQPDLEVAALIFHELAHRRLYVTDHAEFNEAFASFVADVGVERWAAASGRVELTQRLQISRDRRTEFARLFDRTRQQLEELYAGEGSEDAKLSAKSEIFLAFRTDYRAMLARYGLDATGPWLDPGLNNARFASALTYRKLLPAFASLWREARQDPAAFFQAAEELGELPKPERIRRLAKLAGG